MKSRSEIWFALLAEAGSACSVSTIRDSKTATDRVSAEGDSFYTITLPAYEKDLLRSFRLGRIPWDAFKGFSRRKVKGSNGCFRGVPEFLGGFLDLLFTSESEPSTLGSKECFMLPEPVLRAQYGDLAYTEHMAIRCIRQLLLVFSKEKALCPELKIQDAIAKYVDVDAEITRPLESDPEFLFGKNGFEFLRCILRVVFGDALALVDRKIIEGDLVPKHGPGATADHRRGNYKWVMPVWHDRLEYLFSYGEYALPNARFALEGQEVIFLEPEDEPPTRLVAVPKTQAKPRLIAAEPTVMQYIQQAITGVLVPAIEQNSLAGSFTAFTDQKPNQVLAQKGSKDGSLATLDLSDASDRVANWLVEELFLDFPNFLEGIQAARSQRCQLPSGEVIPLQKFASMGSALTFPVEAIVFTVIALAGCLSSSSSVPTYASLKRLVGSVRVYGDDIIVPADMAERVTEELEAYGFKVNRHKSFWTGPFRESCGKEYFLGEDVSCVYIREVLPSSLGSVKELVSMSSFRNLLYKAGWVGTVELIDEHLLTLLRGKYPFVSENSPLLGRIGPELPEIHREGKDLQRAEVRGYSVRANLPKSVLNGIPALTKCLMHPEISEFAWDHLDRSGRPRAVGLKLAWAPVY
jgi:hypothetical protein